MRVEHPTGSSQSIHTAAEELLRDQLVAAGDAIRDDPSEQAELRRIMAELDRISGGAI